MRNLIMIGLMLALAPSAHAARGELRTNSGSSSLSISKGDCADNGFKCAEPDATNRECKILNDEGFANQPYVLGLCLKELQTKMATGSLSAKKGVALGLKSQREQTFLGFVLTCIGEAAGDAEPGDMMAIMKVLDNRTDICKKEMPEQTYTSMDVALQEKQFSMYNEGIYKAPGAFEKGPDDPKTKKCVEAFAKYSTTKKSDWTPVVKGNQISYYYAPGVKGMPPTWANASKEVPNLSVAAGAGAKTEQPITKKGQHIFEAKDWSCKPYAKGVAKK